MKLDTIKDYGTVGGTHLAGEAVFSDGKRFRFILEDGRVKSMAWENRCKRPNRFGTVYDFQEHRAPIPKRAAMILAAHGPYLADALKKDAEQCEAEDKAQARAIAENKRAQYLTKKGESMVELIRIMRDRLQPDNEPLIIWADGILKDCPPKPEE